MSSDALAGLPGLRPRGPMDIDRLFRDHRDSLVRYVARLSGDPDLADDVLQETFVRLQERPPAHSSNLRSWLFTVATNVTRDLARSGTRRRVLLEGAVQPLADAPVGPARAAELAERQRQVRAALGTLREKERTALLMREEGFTHREIAIAVGSTTGSIGTLIARALEKLAARLPLDEERSP